jgi:ribosomal protein S18 acetylase RimI-like enzyme
MEERWIMSMIDVAPLAEAQIDAAAQVVARALQEDPLQTYVLPDPAERALRSPGHFSVLMRYGFLFGSVWTTSGALVGVAICLPPGLEMTQESPAQAGFNRLSALIGAEAVGRFGWILDYLETVHHHVLPPKHWYVMVVGVEPEHQGQGVGSALMRPILDRADADGLPCCLDTAHVRNVSFYQRLGFRVLVETVEPESGLRLWTLCRDPM